MFRPISLEVDLFDPNINDKANRLYKFKDDKGNKFKIWLFTDSIKMEIPLETSLLFSINYPDNVCLANKKWKDIVGIGKIYTDNSENEQIQSCVELLREELKTLRLHPCEGLAVYRNLLQLTLKQERLLIPEIEICRKIKFKIELGFGDKTNEADYSDLPADLRKILEEFGTFATTDDLEREDKIKEATLKQRSDLISAIEPELEEIYSFLNAYGEKPLSAGAIALQNLAEIVNELISERTNKHR